MKEREKKRKYQLCSERISGFIILYLKTDVYGSCIYYSNVVLLDMIIRISSYTIERELRCCAFC